MIKKILLGLVAVVLLLVIVVALQPGYFRVSRSATFNAAPAAVFEHVNDLRRWNAWSPWASLDPNAKYTFAGPPAGTGASLAWAGNNQVGEGRMTITESKPAERVVMDLEFYKPMAGKSITEFTFTPSAGNQTLFTWTMSGKNNFAGKAMSLVMNCDKMIGGQFEQGLANLRKMVEPQGALTAVQ